MQPQLPVYHLFHLSGRIKRCLSKFHIYGGMNRPPNPVLEQTRSNEVVIKSYAYQSPGTDEGPTMASYSYTQLCSARCKC